MLNINEILKQYPTLTPFGFEGAAAHKCTSKFEGDYLRQINTCIDWLKTRKIQKTINRKLSSYSIKHLLERELKTYVSNGCFIAAVIALGIPFETIPTGPNIFVAIGMKELKKKPCNVVGNIHDNSMVLKNHEVEIN